MNGRFHASLPNELVSKSSELDELGSFFLCNLRELNTKKKRVSELIQSKRVEWQNLHQIVHSALYL